MRKSKIKKYQKQNLGVGRYLIQKEVKMEAQFNLKKSQNLR